MIKTFPEVITEAQLHNLKNNKKFLVIGLEVSYDEAGLKKKFDKQVIETPVSELSYAGLAVGLATQGYSPFVHFGRLEFAMLAFDQIFTQASRWDYMFGGNYKCPVTFKIQIGRQWGNGPQHTASYNSIFLNSVGLDLFIPSTPQDCWDHITYTSKNNSPSVILEHRWLLQTSQNIIKKKIKKIPSGHFYEKKSSDTILVTYGDSLPDCLRSREILEEKGINVSILNLSFFSKKKRFSKNIINKICKFKNIYFIDSAPFVGGILNSLSAEVSVFKNNLNIHHLSPPAIPCPTAPKLVYDYYLNYITIANEILKNKKVKKYSKKILTFEDVHLWPKTIYPNNSKSIY